MKRDALISACGVFRYWLLRQWDDALPLLNVLMLNPSTADGEEDDHTVRKLIGFCKQFGYGGFTVVNMYAYRTTSPRQLKVSGFQVGPDNDTHIVEAVTRTPAVLCAWGTHVEPAREQHVKTILRVTGAHTYALRINRDGTPGHPLMLPYSSRLGEFDI